MSKRIYDTYKEAVAENGYAHGVERIILSQSELVALICGKVVAIEINSGEYQGYVAVDEALLEDIPVAQDRR